jgi:group II intron reverse transcriptase/maturase
MRDLSTVFEVFQDRGKRRLPLRRVYRLLYNPELYLRAYGNIYRRAGALTPGIDPDDTVDGMSLKRIEKLINQIRDESFEWKPVRRIYIPKRDGGRRPLGIPGWKDKLLQEAIRIILDAYYEPQFSSLSHGYRPNRGCHTALVAIRTTFKGSAWFIEGDIKGCFDNLDHEMLLGIISRSIKDQRFIDLISSLLRSGYLEDWKYHETFSGTPQGGVLSPLLSNIYLNELDKHVEETLIPAYSRGKPRRRNREYNMIRARSQRAFRRGYTEEGYKWRKVARGLPSVDPFDPDYRKLSYVRYADDFLLGFAGPKAEAREIKKHLANFLEGIGLELSLTKTSITHSRTDKAVFLGYEIAVMLNNEHITKMKNGYTQRAVNGGIWFGVPRSVITEAIRKYTRKGKVIDKPERLVNTPFTIVADFQAEYRGIAEYYAMAHNRSQVFPKLRLITIRSLGKTLAAKLGISSAEVFRRYMTTKVIKGKSCRVLRIIVEREGKPSLEAIWGGISLKRDPKAHLVDVPTRVWSGRTELIERLLADTCEVCGSKESIEVHHVRALKDLNKPGLRKKSEVARKMAARKRKTLIVCKACHNLIHQGLL